MCAAGGGSSTWGNTWERAYSLVVLNERATNESRLLYKKEQHGYNSIGSFASEVEIVPLRASLEVTK